MILYFLLDLPPELPLAFLDGFLPRLEGAWTVFDLVQVRAKAVTAGTYVAAFERVREAVAKEAGAGLRLRRVATGLALSDQSSGRDGRALVLANDRPDVALVAGADGVHVGREDLPPESIRKLDLPPGFVIGLTCHTPDELRAAPGRGADYLGVGAFFHSKTKPGPLPDPRGALRALPVDYPLPVYAIGGITTANIGDVMGTPHVQGIVVSSAIQSSPDPARAAWEFRRLLNESPTG